MGKSLVEKLPGYNGIEFLKMNKDILYNKKSRDQLKQELDAEIFDRITCSFYRYMDIEEPIHFRDALYREWNRLKILGRGM